MAKQKFKITNWKTYNDALRQHGSLTAWLSDKAIASWYKGLLLSKYFLDMAKQFPYLSGNAHTVLHTQQRHII